MKLKTENVSVKLNRKLIITEMLIYHSIFLILIAYDMCTTSMQLSMLFTHKMCQYYQLFQLIFICKTAKLMQRRYNFLTQLIKGTFNRSVYVVSKSVDRMMEEKLKNIFSVYQQLYTLSEAFDAIFGWQIFLILTCTVFSLLNHANAAFLTFKSKQVFDDNLHHYLRNGALYPAAYVVKHNF